MARALAFCMVLGMVGISVGGYQCLKGHTYSVGAQHETTTMGRIVGVGRKGTLRYEFSANGVTVDDYSDVCVSQPAPDACATNGPVLVYYSYQPYPNSLLEDFAAASARAYRIGKPALAIGLPVTVLSWAAIIALRRRNKGEEDPDPEGDENGEEEGESGAIHIVPSE